MRRPATVERVDVALLREAFLASGRSAGDVALAAGMTYRRKGRRPVAGNGSDLRRALGLAADCRHHGARPYRSTRTTIPVDTALRIADALGLDPVDIGI